MPDSPPLSPPSFHQTITIPTFLPHLAAVPTGNALARPAAGNVEGVATQSGDADNHEAAVLSSQNTDAGKSSEQYHPLPLSCLTAVHSRSTLTWSSLLSGSLLQHMNTDDCLLHRSPFLCLRHLDLQRDNFIWAAFCPQGEDQFNVEVCANGHHWEDTAGLNQVLPSTS